MTEKNDRAARIAKALGASRVEDAPLQAKGPLDLVHLRAFVQTRLRSTGGRPTDPQWTMSRQVPFRPERWDQLVELADRITREEQRTVSPAQLAAFLIEEALERLTEKDRGRRS